MLTRCYCTLVASLKAQSDKGRRRRDRRKPTLGAEAWPTPQTRRRPGANTPPRRRDAGPPYLHELGERWAHAKASVAQEHFASVLPRALARDWGRGRGPHALLACVPGDQHDLGLICFGLALRAHGWRITYLGADTRYPR